MSSLCSNVTAGCGNCSPDQLSAIQGLFTDAQTVFLCTNLLTQTVNTSTLESTIAPIATNIQGLNEGLNCTYLILSMALVFVMHAGFAMVR